MSGELKYSTQHIVIGRLPVNVATAQGVGSPLCANCRTECAKEGSFNKLNYDEFDDMQPGNPIRQKQKQQVKATKKTTGL